MAFHRAVSWDQSCLLFSLMTGVILLLGTLHKLYAYDIKLYASVDINGISSDLHASLHNVYCCGLICSNLK